MLIEIVETKRMVCVWLTNHEKNDEDIRNSLKPMMEQYKAKKYKFAVFESGERDLAQQTAALLSHNKKLALSR